MIVLGIVLPIIRFLTKITVAWTIRLTAWVVGFVLILSAQSAARRAVAAIADDDAPQRLWIPGWARIRDRSRLRDHGPGPIVLTDLRGPLGWNR